MTTQIAIPSYKRSETLKNKTVAMLTKYNVSPNNVTVFVANKDEQKIYRDALVNTPYGKNIVVGVSGMGAIRNFIHNYYPVGAQVVNIDDDIEKIQRRVDDKTLVEVESFWQVCQDGFDSCKENGSNLWGVYAVQNAFFMSQKIDVGLKYIIGSFWGCINQNTEEYLVTLDDKEDFERSIKWYLNDGAVCRLNYITCKTKYYGVGGMQEERTEDRIKESSHYLAEKYPELCKAFLRKTTGHWELKLKDTRKYKPVENSLEAFF